MTAFGLMLPHFGNLVSRSRLLEAARASEEAGLASLWARDNLSYQPHAFDPPGRQFLDPFVTLGSVAAVTNRVRLGTAVVVPFRHPLVTSQSYASVAAVAGAGRLVVGLGAGANPSAFDATGVMFDRRVTALRETVEVLRSAWDGGPISHHGELFEFSDVIIEPVPGGGTPIWLGGSSPAALRRVVELADGWLAGRCPFWSFDALRQRFEISDLGSALMPVLSIDTSVSKARTAIDLPGLRAEASGRLRLDSNADPDDLDGVLVAGDPAACRDQLQAFINRGVDEVILDLRLRPDFDRQLELLLEQVLPDIIAAA